MAEDVAPEDTTPAVTEKAVPDNTPGACSSGWKYLSKSRGANTLHQIGPVQSNRNKTGSPATVTFSSTVSGTVSASFTGSTSVSGSVKLASISGQFGVSATASATASIGNTVQITVPAGKTGNGKYGIWNLTVSGTEIRTVGGTCQIAESKPTTTVAPFRVGWDTWIS